MVAERIRKTLESEVFKPRPDEEVKITISIGVTQYFPKEELSTFIQRADRAIPEQYVGPDSDARLAALNAVAREVEATPNQIVIAWMRQGDPPILPIIGGSTAEHLAENLGALGVNLTAEQRAAIVYNPVLPD